MEPTLRSAQVLKQEAEEIGFEGKDILEYVKEQQKLDREERAAWREAQKMQAQEDLELAKIRAEAEEKRRADEIKVQMAKIEAEKELTLRIKPRIKGVRDVKLGDELPEDQRRVLKDLVRRYPDVFTDMPGERLM